MQTRTFRPAALSEDYHRSDAHQIAGSSRLDQLVMIKFQTSCVLVVPDKHSHSFCGLSTLLSSARLHRPHRIFHRRHLHVHHRHRRLRRRHPCRRRLACSATTATEAVTPTSPTTHTLACPQLAGRLNVRLMRTRRFVLASCLRPTASAYTVNADGSFSLWRRSNSTTGCAANHRPSTACHPCTSATATRGAGLPRHLHVLRLQSRLCPIHPLDRLRHPSAAQLRTSPRTNCHDECSRSCRIYRSRGCRGLSLPGGTLR